MVQFNSCLCCRRSRGAKQAYTIQRIKGENAALFGEDPGRSEVTLNPGIRFTYYYSSCLWPKAVVLNLGYLSHFALSLFCCTAREPTISRFARQHHSSSTHAQEGNQSQPVSGNVETPTSSTCSDTCRCSSSSAAVASRPT